MAVESTEAKRLRHEFVEMRDLVQCQVIAMMAAIELMRDDPSKQAQMIASCKKAEENITRFFDQYQNQFEASLGLPRDLGGGVARAEPAT